MLDNQLVKIENIFDPSKKEIVTAPFVLGTKVVDLVNLIGLEQNVIVLLNGKEITDLTRLVMPGDIVCVLPRLHGDDVGKVLGTLAVVTLAWYVGPLVGVVYGTFWGGVASLAIVAAGGILINSLFPPPAIDVGISSMSLGSQIEDSPTYGWNAGKNTARIDAAIPVIYGEIRSYPQIINFYIEIDSAGDQWAHWLLCCGEGLTNNTPDESDIFVGDVLLESFDSDDYNLRVTDGSIAPDVLQLSGEFDKLHQYREFQQSLVADETVSLLHFNGTNGSTTIVEETNFPNDWACASGAQLRTASPWSGEANLWVSGETDYIGTVETDPFKLSQLDILTSELWDIEFRLKKGTGINSGICGINHNNSLFWSINHVDSQLSYQQFYNASGGTPVLYYDLSGEAGSISGEWNHVRVTRSDNDIYLYLDGNLIKSGGYLEAPVASDYKGTWYPTIGKANYYGYIPGEVSGEVLYAKAEVDEFHFKNGGLIYDTLGNFTPNNEETELVDPGVNIETKGVVDEITFSVNAPQGLYRIKPTDGQPRALSVNFNFEYRLKGESTWISNPDSISGNSRYPIKKEFNYSVAQGEYETRVIRTSGNFDFANWAGRTYWVGMDEILDEFLTYPGLQLVSLSLKAQDEFSGPVPNIGVVNNRSSIIVPAFSGSGTITVNPSNNAYAAYDILTNEYYGGGVDPNRFDEDAWNDWIDWCNGLVGSYKRCQFNMIMDAHYDMDKALQHVENTGRAKIIMRGSEISVVIEKPGSPSALFSAGNIKEGSAKLSFLPQAERSDAIEIQFKDKNKLWQNNTVFVPSDNYDLLERVPRVMCLTLPGINNEEQAQREAILRLQISDGIKKTIEFESGIEGIVSVLGDIIRFQQEGNQLAIGGRLGANASGGKVWIDKTINLDSSICKMWIRKSDDTIEELTVGGPFNQDTNVFNVSPISSAKKFDPYIIGHPTQSHYQYRIVSMGRSSEQNIKIKTLQYVSSSYYNNDYDNGNTAL